MKIEGPKKTDSASKTTKKAKTSRSSSSDKASFINHLSAAMGGDGEVDEATSVAGAAGVAGILGIQAAEEATERENRKKAVEYGADVLADLDDLRMGLVTGRYSKVQLERLSVNLQNRRDNVTDQKLIEILDEIDLRAQVEIAKYNAK
jgi:predicted outer membrane protein